MTDLLSTLGFQVRVTGIDGLSFRSQTRQNIKKPVGNILYLNTPPKDAVKLAYVGSNELTPIRDLYIGDRSDELYGNSRTGTVKEFKSFINPIAVSTRNFIVTQIFNSADSGDIPLFFKYQFEEDYANIIPESVRVYDQDFNEIEQDKYKLELIYNYDEDTGDPTTPSHYVLYNNLESTFDELTGEYNVYFIQYTDNSGSVEVSKTTLLDNSNAYRIATDADVWAGGLGLKRWENVYTIDETGNSITVNMSRDLPTAVRYNETKRLRVYGPTNISDTYPWYLRVINGNFNSGYEGYSISYSIPEFSEQAFNPIEPYKLSAYTYSHIISDYLIKLPNENIQSGSLFSSLYIVIRDEDENLLYAITDNDLYNDTDYVDFDGKRVYDENEQPIKWTTSLLLGIDKLSGIAQVDVQLLDSYNIYSTYSFEEDSYVVNSMNMNPIFDREASRETRVVYIVPNNCPTNSAASGQTQSIRWLKVSPSGKINELNQDGSGGNENIKGTSVDGDFNTYLSSQNGYSLNGMTGVHYSWRAETSISFAQEIVGGQELFVDSTSDFPRSGWIRFLDNTAASPEGLGIYRYCYYEKKTTSSFIISNENLKVPVVGAGLFVDAGTGVELVNFIDERSTLSNRIYETELDHRSEESTIPSHVSRYFILAETCINPPHAVDESVKIDLRQNGGGIRPEKYEEAKTHNPKVQWYSNNGNYNGQVTPGNAAIIVKLPVSIKKSFSEEQIRDIIESNIPFGTMPIIRYYGYRPEITSLLPRQVESFGFGEGPFGEYNFGE